MSRRIMTMLSLALLVPVGIVAQTTTEQRSEAYFETTATRIRVAIGELAILKNGRLPYLDRVLAGVPEEHRSQVRQQGENFTGVVRVVEYFLVAGKPARLEERVEMLTPGRPPSFRAQKFILLSKERTVLDLLASSDPRPRQELQSLYLDGKLLGGFLLEKGAGRIHLTRLSADDVERMSGVAAQR